MYFSGGHVEFGETVSTNYNLFFFKYLYSINHSTSTVHLFSVTQLQNNV